MAKAEATVEELVSMIERGQLRLPEMQRRYVWQAPRVRDLLDSLYRGYPSGAILLWETDEEVPLQEMAVAQQVNPYGSTRLLLDGQQRLTSLSAVIRGQPVKVRNRQTPIELLFNLEHPDEPGVLREVNEDSATDDDELIEDVTDSTEDELQQRFNRMTFVVATKKLAALPQWVSVSDVFKTNEDAPLLARAGLERIDDPRYTKFSQRLGRLRGIRAYTYRMDVLERSMSYEEVTEIFVRVNSLGAKLRSSDLALAQITAKWRGALEIFQAYQAQCATAGFDLDLGIHLRNLVTFATGQSRFLAVSGLTLEELQLGWDECKRGMDFATNFLRSNAEIDSPALLASPFILVSLAYYGHNQRYEIAPDEAQRLRQWVLVANAKGRYSRGSSETLLDQDLAMIRDGGRAEALTERVRIQVGRLDVEAEELAGRNQRSALFKTMFIAFRHDGAKDWRSGLQIALDHAGSDKLQFHHIFPKAVLTKRGVKATEADDIANLAFISGKTNLKISDTPPSAYVPTILGTAGQAPFEAQCIPVEPELLEPEQYESFLRRRRELIADRLNSFLGVEASGPAAPSDPVLRALDARVEAVELRLREVIADTLAEHGEELPPHVVQKVRERIADAARKNPSIKGSVRSPREQLSFSDFRELQDAITSKTLWPHLQGMFGSRDVVSVRCGQLAELRNTIRHSRPMNEITRKDGEAALIWFDQVLAGTATQDATKVTLTADTEPLERREWNGRDFYVAFGEDDRRNWDDAVRYGFVSAGGGRWYSQTLQSLFVGARVFAYIPQVGYVGVGTVIEEVKPVTDFAVHLDDGREVPILEAALRQPGLAMNVDDEAKREYLVRVDWIKTVPRERAIKEKGLFANQNTVVRLRDPFTLDRLAHGFGLAETADETSPH